MPSFSIEMAIPSKSFGFFFLVALAVCEHSAVAQETKTQVAPSVPMNVNYPAKVAVPIQYTAGDYEGPYDPLDPKGITAALHRQMKIDGQKNAEIIKSYIPPGLDKLAKKEVVKLAMNEGRRFAVAHPRETADIIGIATRAKGLFESAAHKVKAMEKEKNHN